MIVCRENPSAFMAVVLNDSIEERYATLKTIDDLITCECIRYGYLNDPSLIPNIVTLFNDIFFGQTLETKRRIYSHVAMIVSEFEGRLVGAFMPFMMIDTDLGIVSTATVDYASLGPLINNDPMTRPLDVIDMLHRNLPRNSAAVIGGLLVLGDPRVCKLLEPLRPTIEADQVADITKAFSCFSTKCVIEFYLDWIEELVDERDYQSESVIGHVMAGLGRLAKYRTHPFIIDGLRPFPVPPQGTSAWPSMSQIDFDEFTQSIALRLYDLERRESMPKVMPHVIRAFGLEPRTPSEDIGVMQ
jgi:hypothetical protein